MIQAGLVNMDTSHPAAFAELMKKMGRIRYLAVYDDSFRTPAEVESFIEKFGLVKRCATLEELAEISDIGFLHGCNWDDHLRCAEPFLKRKKPVFIDKPLAGSLKDCRRMRRWAAEGAVILGASALRYAREIKSFLELPAEERGEIISIFASAGVDEFYYGIHLAEAIGALMNRRAEMVSYIGKAEVAGQIAHSYCISFPEGKNAIMTIVNGEWRPFSITILTTMGTYSLLPDEAQLYEALLTELCNYLEHKENRLAKPEELIDSVELMLAALASREGGGKAVALVDLEETMPAYDGRDFWEKYRQIAK